jgi:RNA polymerase sigma factor (sigma-70 family)
MSDQQQWLADEFEQHRSHLRAVAYRMLGSVTDADDALQDAWLRVSRADTSEVENLGGWLTTVVARVALNMLRARRTRGERSLEVRVPDPIIDAPGDSSPEHAALLADSVGLALLVVLEQLSPPERLAFVLHDMFAVPFDDIAAMLERSPDATRQLASRARRRVRGATPGSGQSIAVQWELVEAFMAAAREGDFDGLVAVLDPNVVLRADAGESELTHEIRGAGTVASQAAMWSRVIVEQRRALVNGAAGLLSYRDGQLFSVMGLTVDSGRIVEINILADPARIATLDLSALD